MEKLITTAMVLLAIGTIAIGLDAVRDLNDGRVLAMVKSIATPQLQSATASEVQKIREFNCDHQ